MRSADINQLNDSTHLYGAVDFQYVLRCTHVGKAGDTHLPSAIRRGDYYTTGCRIPLGLTDGRRACWRLRERLPAALWEIDVADGSGYLGGEARPQRGGGKNEYVAVKLSWLRDQVRRTPKQAEVSVLKQFARCYILLMIGCWLFLDKSDNMVSVRWVPLLEDLDACARLSWGVCGPQLHISSSVQGRRSSHRRLL
ncbi:hypothetical protein PIB30_001669 [Stylosanthes scabra]|uniref:Aminotransferase-like plant mobile domain-containing protein n=1 Tax=Stylosanthes scabra TaxID=79078 RepID=A0ABU6T2M5_9FABA|nr:hypothetical protein [Stylosanthes scabra]